VQSNPITQRIDSQQCNFVFLGVANRLAISETSRYDNSVIGIMLFAEIDNG